MLPIRDRNPSPTAPVVVCALIGINLVVFLFELSLPEADLPVFFAKFGIVPEKVMSALRGQDLTANLLIPAVTCMFLHGGWLHLVGNMWFLWIFGDNVEGRLTHGGFLVFYLLFGLAAMAFQVALTVLLGGPEAMSIPNIGASGAIAGVLGLYAVSWPNARVLTLVWIVYVAMFVELPAMLVLGFWFALQVIEGVMDASSVYASGGVAFGAHVGGFVAGALLGLVLGRPKPRPYRRRR